MKEETIGGHTVRYYQSIEDMPVMRYHKFNKLLLVDSGIGSDASSIMVHIEKAIRYAEKSPKDAIVELQNARQGISLAMDEISPKNVSFAALVASIDGVPTDDLSDEGLQKVIQRLSSERMGFLTRLIEAVKKKTKEELDMYFPGKFDNAKVKEYYDLLKKRTLLVLGNVLGKKASGDMDTVEYQMLMLSRPMVFYGTGNAEASYQKQFERLNVMMTQTVGVDVKSMTVLEYYNAFEYMKEELKRKKNGR
jgi:hypothetical protein